MNTSMEDIIEMVSPWLWLRKVYTRSTSNIRLGAGLVPEWVTWHSICGSLWTMQRVPAHFGQLCFESRDFNPVAPEGGTPRT